MKVYGELTVRGSVQALDSFISALQQELTDGWSRHFEREAQVGKAALGRLYCFACTGRADRPASELWVATHSDGSLYVSNILAQQFSSLTYDQYNSILSNFYESCAKRAAEIAGTKIELGNQNPILEDFLSANTAKLLRNFSGSANRSSLHPLDRERWNTFLAAAYREGTELTASMLLRWFIEDEKWPEDEAMSLTMEYENARDLLQTYEAQQA